MPGDFGLLRSMFRECYGTFNRAAEAINEEEFCGYTPSTVSMGWTLLHLTGLLEWISCVVTGLPTTAPAHILDNFRGGEDVDATQPISLAKPEIIQLFVSAQTRYLSILDANPPFDVKSPISDDGARILFPNVGSLLAAVVSQGFFHLGQMSVSTPTLKNDQSLTMPTEYKDGQLIVPE